MGSYSYFCALIICIVKLIVTESADWNTEDFMKRDHSISKPYHGSSSTLLRWDFVGSTIVTDNYIRLTGDFQSKQGAIWNAVPCTMRNWEIQINFKVHGSGKDLFGDGLAIWYTKDRMQQGPVFGNKDFFHGLAVILDTYSNHNGPHNHQHPYISAMVNNGSLHYDHDRDGTHTQLAGCEAKFRNLNHDTYLSVRYERDTLTVSTDIAGKAGWQPCFTVNDVKLPTEYYFGISASTGDLSDNHDILFVHIYDLDLPTDEKDTEDRSKIIPSAARFEPPRDHVDDPKPSSLSGIKIFFLMLIASLALIACVVIGVMFYQKHQENSRKRLY